MIIRRASPFGKPKSEAHNYETSAYIRNYDFVGLVLAYDAVSGIATVEQRNNFRVGDQVEITGPQTDLSCNGLGK